MAGPFKVLARQIWIKDQERKPPATGDAIVPQAVQAGSSDKGAEVVNLVNRSGLRDQDGDHLDEHSVDPAQMWRSAQGETACWLEFDLGQAQPLGAIGVWNHNDAWHTERGIRKMDISVWTQESGWRKVHDDVAIDRAQGSDDYDEPTLVRLDAVQAQKIRFDDLAGFGDADFVGLSEVQFFKPLGPQAIRPSPSDGALGVSVSGLELKWVAGEGAKAHSIYLGAAPEDLKPLGRIGRVGAKISPLNNKTRYYWRIDEVRADGSVAAGPVWSFTTGGGFAVWWKLDETPGSALADSSGHGYYAVVRGGPTWQPQGGRIGGALQFDGSDDYVDTGWADHLPTWTVAAWVKSPAAPKSSPLPGGLIHREKNFQINWDHGDDPFRGSAAVSVGGTWHSAGFGDLKADTWHHLAATYDGENLKAYTDGVLVTNNSSPSGDADPDPATLKFGRHASDARAFFAGMIDEVCVFACALDAGEVKALYAGAEPGKIADRKALAEPRLLQATLADAVAPVAQVQPAAAAPSAAGGESRANRNWIAVAVIIGIVALIAGVSFIGRQQAP